MAIGVITDKKKKGRRDQQVYQESVTASLSCKFDDDAVEHDDGEEEAEVVDAEAELVLGEVLSSVQKVCHHCY